MSKKDYELIARVIREYGDSEMAHRKGLAFDFAHALAEQNPRFDQDKFVKACGVS